MTVGSAGQGSKIYTRSLGAPVKGGAIVHSGKINYYRMKVAAINANLQNGRGGAETQYYDCFDPEYETIQKFKNQLTPLARQVRGLDYAMCMNNFFISKAALNEDVALLDFSKFEDLYEAMAEKDTTVFEALYNKYLQEGRFNTFANAREILYGALREAIETGRHYWCNLSEMNRHTPFKDKIYQSNLCLEIALPTKPFNSVEELYYAKHLDDTTLSEEVRRHYQEKVDNVEGEVATCALAGIAVGKIKTEEEYAEAAWVALDMIHTGIKESDYMLPHIGYTSKKRMSAGVGIVDLAHALAKNKLKYSSQAGRDFIHKTCEKHYWYLLNASLQLSQEFGNAEWMDKTRWTDENSWLPIDTYKRTIDEVVTVDYQYDWESIRQRIIANGGHLFSVLVAHMPGESSTISAACTNGIYPARDIAVKKTNETRSFFYVVPESDSLGKYYESAWDISTEDMAKVYGIAQKWCDQTISADNWVRISGSNKLTSDTLFRNFFVMIKYGCKTRYYINSNTAKQIDLNATENTSQPEANTECEGCTL